MIHSGCWRETASLRSCNVMNRCLIAWITIFIVVTSTATRELDIRRPPSIIKSPLEYKTFRTDSGDALVLECVADGSPEPEYYWEKNGQSLTGYGGQIRQISDGTISILQLGTIDEGYYQCFATNRYGISATRTVHLERAVLANYIGKSINEHEILKEGTSYMLPCNRTKWFPKPSFSWAVVDSVDDPTEKVITLDKRVQMDDDGNLHFSYVVPSDSQDGRLYKCKLFNPILDVTFGGSYARLRVQSTGGVLPFPTATRFITPSPVIGLEGRSVTLRCFFSGSPEPTIQWKRAQGMLPIGRTIPSNFNTALTLINLTKSDSGKYSCTGQNTRGNIEEEFILHVEAVPVFPRIEDQPHDINVTDGDTITISCNPYATPNASIMWMKNREILNPRSLPAKFRLSDDGRILTVRDLCRDCNDGTNDLMVIQCNASNIHGYAFADAYVNVLKKTVMSIKAESQMLPHDPNIGHAGPEQYLIPHDQNNIQFSFSAESDDSTPVKMQWFKVTRSENKEQEWEQELRTSVEHGVYIDDRGLLKLNLPHNESAGDRSQFAGIYRARADNGYSRTETDVLLKVERAPPTAFLLRPPAAASLWDFWWIIVIVAAILLLLLLILCCCLCIQRNRGDTYLVTKEELKNKDKSDLEKEIEAGGFHEYSRPDGKQWDNPATLLNSLNKVDNNSDDSCDDVSLDYGHEDTGKYTEDGSFIGDYAKDAARRNGAPHDNYTSDYRRGLPKNNYA